MSTLACNKVTFRPIWPIKYFYFSTFAGKVLAALHVLHDGRRRFSDGSTVTVITMGWAERHYSSSCSAVSRFSTQSSLIGSLRRSFHSCQEITPAWLSWCIDSPQVVIQRPESSSPSIRCSPSVSHSALKSIRFAAEVSCPKHHQLGLVGHTMAAGQFASQIWRIGG